MGTWKNLDGRIVDDMKNVEQRLLAQPVIGPEKVTDQSVGLKAIDISQFTTSTISEKKSETPAPVIATLPMTI